MDHEVIVEELNTILRGTYMGIRAFEHYIQELDHTELKEEFQTMHQELKQSAASLSERIQNLGGIPADDEGISGKIHSFMHKVMLPDDQIKIMEDAIEGMDHYGVQYSEEIVKGDLDVTSKQIVEDVINTNRRLTEKLRQLLHES